MLGAARLTLAVGSSERSCWRRASLHALTPETVPSEVTDDVAPPPDRTLPWHRVS